MSDLITLPPKESALQVFSKPRGLDPFLEPIRSEIDAFVPDVSTKKGRDAIASMAFKVARSKTAIDDVGKQLAAELKELPKLVDAERKRVRDTLDAWKEEVRKPLDDWQAAEDARVDGHKQRLWEMQSSAELNPERTADEIRSSIAMIEEYRIDESWEEFEAEAHRAKAKTLETLKAALVAREKHEAEQTELARLRAEAEARAKRDEEERIAREAVERATREAEERARIEREESARREAEAKAAAERAERERLEAIERQKQAEARAEAEKLAAEQRAKDAAEAARQAEIKRQSDEAARIEAEQRKREADKAHKARINNEAMSAFIAGGLTPEAAKLAVMLIAKGNVPAVSISY